MASTYENDLRLEEMATGENSGSWGTKTNTNLELVADAFSYGTEIIANADTAITIADGAADAARSLALKITSSEDLTTTRVITLGPNTVSKVWIIENSTSGSQTLTISAGSGSNITLANGKTKIIATDGIGAGSNVVELTQDIAIADLFVDDDLTVGDDIIMNSDGGILKIGADADLQVTHSGSAGTITNASGNLTIDVVGELIIDADLQGAGNGVILKDDGIAYGSFFRSSSNLHIKAEASDQDMLFMGNDNGSEITALTLDMSEAGAATFNAGVTLSGDLTVDTDTLYVDSTNDRVGINESTPLEALHITTSDSGTTISKTVGNTSGPVLVLDNTDDTTNNLAGIQFASSGSSSTDVTASTGIYSINTGRGGTYSYGEMAFYTTTTGGAHTESFRVDSSQRVLIGTTSTRSTYKHTVANTTGVARIFGIANGGVDSLHFDQARGSVASPTASNADGDGSYISFSSYDGTNWDDIGSLAVVTDGAQDSGRMIFRTTPTGSSQTERMRITSGGRVGINTVSESGTPLGYLTIDNDINSANVLTNKASYHVVLGINGSHTGEYIGGIGFGDITQTTIQAAISTTDEGTSAATGIAFATGNTSAVNEAMRIDSSRRVLIGGTSSVPMGDTNHQVQLQGNNFATSSNVIQRYEDQQAGPMFAFAKSRNGTIGSQTIVEDGDQIGKFRWYGSNGSNFTYYAAEIEALVDGTPGGGADMPGRIVFKTTADGAGASTERMRIDSTGTLKIGNVTGSGVLSVTNTSTTDGNNMASFSGTDVNQRLIVANYKCGSAEDRVGLLFENQGIANMRVWMGDDQKLYSKDSNPTDDQDGNYFVQVNGSGNIAMPNGKGIDFSATGNGSGTTTSEVLDDYEEGDFTPTLLDGAGVSRTLSFANGRYTKIGRTVHVYANITRNDAGGTAGNLKIGGLPFTSASGESSVNGGMWVDEGGPSTNNGDTVGLAYVSSNQTSVSGVQPTAPSQQTSDRYHQYSQLTNGRSIYMAATYESA